jgi:hypothetical protein
MVKGTRRIWIKRDTKKGMVSGAVLDAMQERLIVSV